MRTPNPIGRSTRERGFRHGAVVHKPDATENVTLMFRNRDAKILQGFDAIRHESFTARLIDWRNSTVYYQYAQTVAASGNGRSQTGRSTANYKYIPRLFKVAQHAFLSQQRGCG